ncbi:MAG: tetratricopeptide repeat protein [Deltaproteobacteria bacterium]|nr:tetratricopeptide repeat protein [Deltaproteobacteria bacterium]
MEENPTTAKRPIPIKCPVCPLPETTSNPCPQCGTDLEPLRRLRLLPEFLEEEAFSQSSQEIVLGPIASLAAAVALSPASLSHRLALARALLAKGDIEEAERLIRQILKHYPENSEVETLGQLLLEAQQNRVQAAEAARKGARKMVWWKFSALTAYAFTMAFLTLLIWQPFTTSPLPGPELPPPPERWISIPSPPQFPLVLIERNQGSVRLSGEVKTMPELLQVLKETSTVHGLNLDGMKVNYEHSFLYCVQPHDTLTSLAWRFYRQGAKWTLIQEANASRLQNPDLLKQGELLLIPAPVRSPDGVAPNQNNRR